MNIINLSLLLKFNLTITLLAKCIPSAINGPRISLMKRNQLKVIIFESAHTFKLKALFKGHLRGKQLFSSNST